MTTLHRPIASSPRKAAKNAVKASQIVWTANIAETPGAALVVKDAARNAVGASQIVGAAKVAGDSGNR